MSKKKHPHRKAGSGSQRSIAPMLVLGVLSVVGSFGIGIRFAGDVQPIDALEAQEIESLEGDLDGNGSVDVHDVLTALDIVLGTIDPEPFHLKADPTPDGRLTIEDARRIASLASR